MINKLSASCLILVLLTVLPLTSPIAATSEEALVAHGKELHDEFCVGCHTDAVYTRENRRVKSLEALKKQVVRCRDMNDLLWYDEDIEAVVQFLNTRYYKF
jgi:mono/diheme cytochrome c family protein